VPHFPRSSHRATIADALAQTGCAAILMEFNIDSAPELARNAADAVERLTVGA
jgi:2-keto-3-deoxy-6-phosphogluconate aldolase